jgi:putative hydrolase of HD superfamily
VHDIDKLEMVLHTFEYERCHQRYLSEFYHVMHSIRLPEMRDWGLMMMKEREHFEPCVQRRD